MKYDVLIIGSGIAGLCTGLYLQKLGKRSLILEHGDHAGGNMSGVWRKGFYFDCGDQSTENVGVLFPLLEELDLYDPDEWMQVKFRYASRDFNVPLYDFGQIREDFKKVFPESSPGLDKWFDFLAPQAMAMKKMMGSGSFPLVVDGWSKMRANLRMMMESASMLKTSKEMVIKTGDEKARQFFPHDPRLIFLFGEYGCRNMFLMYHVSFWYTFLYDYWYPKAGLQGFIDKVAKAYQERGGEIRFKSTVDRVITSGEIVTALETASGERFYADHVVNTGNPKRLINQMLDNPNRWDYKDRQLITAGPVSKGQTAAYLGIDMSAAELGKHLQDHHTHFFRTYETVEDMYDRDLHNKGWSMISATSLHLPHLAPEGKSSIVVQVFIPYHWLNGWGTGSADPFVRNQAYQDLKARVLNDIIKETEYVIPGLSEKIVYQDLGSPRALARFTLNEEGSPQGWSYDLYRTHRAYKFARFRTPFKNLFNAGHYAVWPGGVIFSALSGRIVARGIYGGFWRQLFI